MEKLYKSKPLTKEQEEIVDVLFEKVKKVTGCDKKTIVSKKRNSNLVMIRMIMASILRNEAHLTYHSIGLSLIRDHSSVLYYTKKHIDNLIYPPYNRLYYNILDRMVHKITRTDLDAFNTEIDKAQSKLNNLKYKKKLVISARRRYELSEI